MEISEFISTMPVERQATLTALHKIIIATDPSVTPVIKPMMGKDMILYEERCYMKYGLASVKNHLSFHCMPIYMNPALHAKYLGLLPATSFQKGCINFTNGEDMLPEVFTALITDCAAVNIAEVLENRKKKK
jgi:hypothetical protein